MWNNIMFAIESFFDNNKILLILFITALLVIITSLICPKILSLVYLIIISIIYLCLTAIIVNKLNNNKHIKNIYNNLSNSEKIFLNILVKSNKYEGYIKQGSPIINHLININIINILSSNIYTICYNINSNVIGNIRKYIFDSSLNINIWDESNLPKSKKIFAFNIRWVSECLPVGIIEGEIINYKFIPSSKYVDYSAETNYMAEYKSPELWFER